MAKRGRKRKKKQVSIQEHFAPETRHTIFVVSIFILSLLGLLSLFGWAGNLGEFIKHFLNLFFGWGQWILPFCLLVLGYISLKREQFRLTWVNYLGFWLAMLMILGIFHLFFPLDEMIYVVEFGRGGGYMGLLIAFPTVSAMGHIAGFIVLICLFILGIVCFLNGFLHDVMERFGFLHRIFVAPFQQLFAFTQKDDDIGKTVDDMQEDEQEHETEDDDQEEEEPEDMVQPTVALALPKQLVDMSRVKFVDSEVPKQKSYGKVDIPLDLLVDKDSRPMSGNTKQNKAIIQKTLEHFNINVTMGEHQVGPSVTQYTLKPEQGIRLSRILALTDDLSLALAAHPIRIEAPIPGKPLVGIEVPNKGVAIVNLREVLASEDFKQARSKGMLTIGLGKDVAGSIWTEHIPGMPHLLVAGATGSGKSVCLNTIVLSLLYQHSPDELKFIMIDPKRVGLTMYDGIPYLLESVITDVKKTVNALKWAIGEMDRRYKLLQKEKRSNIADFNKKTSEPLPYIIIMIDELADLMVTAARDVEPLIIRLAQMARAVGIHLVLATQRPSVDVITGLIKSNITTRIAFAVASGTDSRTILDSTGAEKLMGRGDMLYSSAKLSKPVRLQGAYVSDDEIHRVVHFIKDKYGEGEYTHEITEKQNGSNGQDYDSEDDDNLYEDAKQVVIAAGKASTSFLQRRFRIGFSRAGRLMDMLEERGIIGPAQGAKPREVYATEEGQEQSDPEGERENT